MDLISQSESSNAHAQLISSLASRITEVYNNDFMNSHLKHDVACRLIAKSMGANSVSLLLYNGNHDDLYCAGSYIDPDEKRANARLISQKSISPIINVMKYISVFEFIKYSGIEKGLEVLYAEYIKYPFSNPILLSFDEFRDFPYATYQKYFKDYIKFKTHFQEDRYSILPEKTITGLFYFILSRYAESDKWESGLLKLKAKLFPLNNFFICDINKIAKKHKTCFENLRKKLKVEIDANAYYIGIPLEVNERPIGILRIILKREIIFEIPKYGAISQAKELHSSKNSTPVMYSFHNYEDVYKYVSEIINCQNIALLLSLHLNNAFYAHGMRQIALKPNLTKDFENKNTVANELTEVVNCFGCIVRYSDSKKGKALIHGYSDSMFSYFTELSKLKDPYIDNETGQFKRVFIDLFYTDVSLQNTSADQRIESVKIDFIKNEVSSISYQYFQENYKLLSTDQWPGKKLKKLYKELRNIFNTNYEVFALFDIRSIVIIPIKEKEYGFVTLANTSNRQFLTKDIEMIIPVVKRVGIELKYKNTLESLNVKKEEWKIHSN